MHIIDELIAERAPRLYASKKLYLVRRLLYYMLARDLAVKMADRIRDESGFRAFSWLSDYIRPRTKIEQLAHLPAQGRCMIIANHPTGLADGIVLFQAIRTRRPDHIFLANADALRVIPYAHDLIIPVEWVKSKRNSQKTRQTLIQVKNALEAERCVIIFPSGALARMSWRGVTERPWESSAVQLARKNNAPIIPLTITAHNSILYYVFSIISHELRDITLFRELLNKNGQVFSLKFSPAINPQSLSGRAKEATQMIRNIVIGRVQ